MGEFGEAGLLLKEYTDLYNRKFVAWRRRSSVQGLPLPSFRASPDSKMTIWNSRPKYNHLAKHCISSQSLPDNLYSSFSTLQPYNPDSDFLNLEKSLTSNYDSLIFEEIVNSDNNEYMESDDEYSRPDDDEHIRPDDDEHMIESDDDEYIVESDDDEYMIDSDNDEYMIDSDDEYNDYYGTDRYHNKY